MPSGIPDFRTPGTGLWANVDPMEVAHIDVFRRDPRRFWQFYGERFQTLEDKQPNRAHEVLAELERDGLLDGGDHAEHRPPARARGLRELIEVHGTIGHSSCLGCGPATSSTRCARRSGPRGDGVPRCDCEQPLKPDVVLFGEYLPEDALERAHSWRRRPT